MVDRIKELIEIKGLTPAAFANLIEINRSGLTHIFSGRNQPSLDLIRKILLQFPDISTDWLMFGEGEMYRGNLPEVAESDSSPIIPSRQPQLQGDLFSSFADETKENRENQNNPSENIPPLSSSHVREKEIFEKKKEVKTTPTETSKKERRAVQPRETKSTSDSPRVKPIEKIICIYRDKTFEVFYQEL